jgi:hypothetical protein
MGPSLFECSQQFATRATGVSAEGRRPSIGSLTYRAPVAEGGSGADSWSGDDEEGWRRAWVLALPYRLRYRLAWDHALCRAVLGVYARVLLAFYARTALSHGVQDGPDIVHAGF